MAAGVEVVLAVAAEASGVLVEVPRVGAEPAEAGNIARGESRLPMQQAYRHAQRKSEIATNQDGSSREREP